MDSYNIGFNIALPNIQFKINSGDSIQNIIQFNSGNSIQKNIQFNSQGMINTGRIGKVPKN